VTSATQDYLAANGGFFLAAGASALLFLLLPSNVKLLGLAPIGIYGFTALRSFGGIT
jgi:hypothetical protein